MMIKTLEQRFFELADSRPMQGRTWIPLRQDQEESLDGNLAGVADVRTYSGYATLAVETAMRAIADEMTWSELDNQPHRCSIENGIYRPADFHCEWKPPRKVIGTRLIIAQSTGAFEPEIWHLHPDLIIAIGLQCENDIWYRPEEGWPEVARLKRNAKGEPALFEMRSEFLSDYLAARGMALFASSYHQRDAFLTERPAYAWADKALKTHSGRDKREAYVVSAEFPPGPDLHFEPLAHCGAPNGSSRALRVRVRGDVEPGTVTFTVGNSGERKTAQQCIGAMTWLAFQPTLVPALLRYRSGHLGWYTANTGSLGASHGLHFGINDLGLITIFAKDIAKLDEWEQRIWAAHSTVMDGGVSQELFDAQMQCRPASTKAPEVRIEPALKELTEAFKQRYGVPLLREHASIKGLIARVHRFRALEDDGLLALAKDLNRLLMERIDIDAVRGPAKIGPKDKIGSLKAIEGLLTQLIGAQHAKTAMAPLFGINDLRNADSHLGSSLIASGFERAGVDTDHSSLVEQGRQLIQSYVQAIAAAARIIRGHPDEPEA
jgi:hypothetical protein